MSLQNRDKKIAESIDNFGKSIPLVQKEIYSKFIDMVSDLSIASDGRIKATKSNLLIINRFRATIKKTLRGKYKKSVNKLIDSWSVAEKQTNKYFDEIA